LYQHIFSVAELFFHLLQNPERMVTSYFLPLIFGLIILPEETPFALPVDLQASLQDVGEIILNLLLTIYLCKLSFLKLNKTYSSKSYTIKWIMHVLLL